MGQNFYSNVCGMKLCVALFCNHAAEITSKKLAVVPTWHISVAYIFL